MSFDLSCGVAIDINKVVLDLFRPLATPSSRPIRGRGESCGPSASSCGSRRPRKAANLLHPRSRRAFFLRLSCDFFRLFYFAVDATWRRPSSAVADDVVTGLVVGRVVVASAAVHSVCCWLRFHVKLTDQCLLMLAVLPCWREIDLQVPMERIPELFQQAFPGLVQVCNEFFFLFFLVCSAAWFARSTAFMAS